MGKTNKVIVARHRRHKRIRKRMKGTKDVPRLSVFRSNHHIYAQVIDDEAGTTLVAASTLDKDLRGTPDTAAGGTKVGESLAKKAGSKGIKQVVFDRAGFKYHGAVKSLAEAARKGGLEF